MSNSAQVNSLGLTPEQSKALPEREPREDEKKIIAALKDLYSCNPSVSSYTIYADNATFHDPIGIATGIDAVKGQFNALAKLFSKAEIHNFRVLQNPQHIPENSIVIDQDVAYFLRDPDISFRPDPKPTKVVNSLVMLQRDSDGKVLQHLEEWDHQKNKTSEDGFLGKLNEARKKFTAGLTKTVVDTNPPEKPL